MRSARRRWWRWLILLVLLSPLLGIGGLYGIRAVESYDPFCTVCHLQDHQDYLDDGARAENMVQTLGRVAQERGRGAVHLLSRGRGHHGDDPHDDSRE